MAASYAPLEQEVELSNAPHPIRPKPSPRRKCAIKATRILSKLAFAGFALTVFVFAFLHVRSPRAVHLSPFEMAPIRACPSLFESAEVNAPFPSADYVSVHRVSKKEAVQLRTKTYELDYKVSLFNDDLSPKSHYKTFHFDPVEPFTIHFESSSPVLFFVKHETGFRHYDHRYRNKEHGRPHPTPGHPSPAYSPAAESSPIPPVEDRAPHHGVPQHRGQIRHPHLNQGKYILVVAIPPNSTADAHVSVKIVAKVTTLVFQDCPFASSLKEGHTTVHFEKKKHERLVIAASPNSPTGTIVFVKLIPRMHKFNVVGLSFLAAWAVLRIINRCLRCHSKRACKRGNNNGERRPCIWSRIFKRREVQQPQVVEFQTVSSSPQVVSVSAPIFYQPQI